MRSTKTWGNLERQSLAVIDRGMCWAVRTHQGVAVNATPRCARGDIHSCPRRIESQLISRALDTALAENFVVASCL
jgi:hypothetical protein